MSRPIVVLAGNPNVGKTTLFNALTGLSAKVSNYPGITVERRGGTMQLPGERAADLHDLPGTYSLNARSAEEQIAFEAIAGIAGEPLPDAVVVVVDATQVARSAYLLLQCQELGARCVVALTMVDEAKTATPDPRALSELLGCDVVAVTARTKSGLPELRAAIDRAVRSDPRAVWRWQPSAELRERLTAVRAALPDSWLSPAPDKKLSTAAVTTGHCEPSPGLGRGGLSPERDNPPRPRPGEDRHAPLPAERGDALALWALTCIAPRTGGPDDDELAVPDVLRTVATDKRGVDLDAPILARWKWLDTELGKLAKKRVDRSLTQKIDRVLLHRVAGFAVFVGVMTVLFMSLFWWAQPAIDGVDGLFKWLGAGLRDVLGDGVFTDFLVDGVIGGVGAVLVFLPQILLLFLFLGFLEDCGYLARVAYLMDRIMRSMNLHGRAFVPMLSGFACAVPAILATRTMERRRDRILTMMVVPLMTCSARLPVYTLVIAALIPGSAFTQASLMVGMYLFSVATALAAAWVMSKTVKPLKAKRLPFLIELPPYRWPRWADVFRMMWGRSSMFLREAGTVILVCSIALWALLAFPRELPHGSPDYDAMIDRAGEQANVAYDAKRYPEAVAFADEAETLASQKSSALLANSYAGRLGHAIEPAIKPLGFDWKIGVGIIGAFAAREVFVSTLGIVYSVDTDKSTEPLRSALRAERSDDGSRAYTPLVGISLMIFFALACQCMSTLAVVRRETRSWRWPLFLFSYMTVLAYIASFLVYQGGKLLGFA